MVVTFVLPHRIFGPGALSTDAARVRNSCDVFRFNVSHYVRPVAFLSTHFANHPPHYSVSNWQSILTVNHHRLDLKSFFKI